MSWKSFSENKNVDDPKTHEEFLRGGITTKQLSWSKATEIISDSMEKYYNFFREREPGLDENNATDFFVNLVSRKFARDLVSFHLISSPEDFEIWPGHAKYKLNNTVTPDDWSDDEEEENDGLIKKYVRVSLDFAENKQFYVNLSARGVTRTHMKKYDSLFDYCVMACTKIIRTMELRLQNIIDVINFTLVSRGVRGNTFLDVFADTQRENAPLLAVYHENRKYLRYIEKITTFKLVPKEYAKTFDLDRIKELLIYGLFSDNMGFYVEENYEYAPIVRSAQAEDEVMA